MRQTSRAARQWRLAGCGFTCHCKNKTRGGWIWNDFLPTSLPRRRWPAKHQKTRQAVDFSFLFLVHGYVFLSLLLHFRSASLYRSVLFFLFLILLCFRWRQDQGGRWLLGFWFLSSLCSCQWAVRVLRRRGPAGYSLSIGGEWASSGREAVGLYWLVCGGNREVCVWRRQREWRPRRAEEESQKIGSLRKGGREACVQRLRKKKIKREGSVLLAERGEEDGGTMWRQWKVVAFEGEGG